MRTTTSCASRFRCGIVQPEEASSAAVQQQQQHLQREGGSSVGRGAQQLQPEEEVSSAVPQQHQPLEVDYLVGVLLQQHLQLEGGSSGWGAPGYVTPGHPLCCSPTEAHGVKVSISRNRVLRGDHLSLCLLHTTGGGPAHRAAP